MDKDSEPSFAERGIARHKRFGLIDLAVVGVLVVGSSVGLIPWWLAAAIAGFYALTWASQYFGYWLALRQEHREAAIPDSVGEDQAWKPGERSILAYMALSSVAVSGVVILGAWAAVHSGFAPRWLAVAMTAFVAVLEIGAIVMFLVVTRRILRERARGSDDSTR